MQSYRLRAVDRRGRPHIFVPQDVPVRTFDDLFILANVPGSPAMRVGSVVRVMDHMDVGEGDHVMIDGDEYTAHYRGGFYFSSDRGVVIRSNHVSSCEVLSIGDRTESRIQFRSPNKAFRLQSFLGCYNGRILCSHDHVPFAPEELQLSADVRIQQRKLYFGDDVDGHVLMMYRGRPCVCVDGAYIEVPSNVLLGREE